MGKGTVDRSASAGVCAGDSRPVDDEPPTTVINLRTGEPYDIRIDRRTPFGNPFRLTVDTPADRVICLRNYATWLAHPDRRVLLDCIPRLRGKRLACWCHPDLCHGHLLAALADGLADTPREAADVAIQQWELRMEEITDE